MKPENFIRLNATCEPTKTGLWDVSIENVDDPEMRVDYTIKAKTDSLAVQHGMQRFTESIQRGLPDSGKVEGILNATYPRIVS
jgi:hypothetical protein